MERFELQMADRHAEQRGHGGLPGEIEQAVHAAFELFRGDRREADPRAAAAADVVLLGLELAGVFRLAAGIGQQELVRLPDQRLRQGLAVLHRLTGGAQGTPVEVGLHGLGTVFVAGGQVRIGLRFQFQDLLQGAEGALHARRGERFLATQGREQDLAVVHALEHLIVAGQRIGGFEQGPQHAGSVKGLRREASVVVIDSLTEIDLHSRWGKIAQIHLMSTEINFSHNK